MSSFRDTFSTPKVVTILFLLIIFPSFNAGCHQNGFVPFTKGFSCISIISNPLLSYTEAIDYTSNNLSALTNEQTSLLSLHGSNSSTLNEKVLSLYASRKGIDRMWLYNKCGTNCSAGCVAYYTNDRTMRDVNCNEQLPFVAIISRDIHFFDQASIDLSYHVNGTSFTVQIPSNIVINSSVNVTWLHNGVPLDDDNHTTHTTTNSTYDLLFDPFIAENDSGLYQLILSNSVHGGIIFMVQIEEAIISQFTVSPANVTIPIGQIAVIECESSQSLPPPNITWSYTNSTGTFSISALDAMRYRISTLNTLYIREMAVDDSGWYTCTASNIAGSKSARAYLNVTTYPINTSEVVISQHPRNQSIFVGDSYTIECNVMLRTPQSVDPTRVTSTLYYTYQEIPSLGQTTSRRSVFYYSLIVKTFPSMVFTGQEEGQDQFQCTMNINLQAAQQPIYILHTNIATITINARASITALFTNTSGTLVPYRAGLEIYCDFTGPGVNWYLNGHPYHGHITLAGSRSTLIIPRFEHFHFGTYQCVTSNNDYQMYYRSLSLSVKDGIPEQVSFTVTSITSTSINIKLIPSNITKAIHPDLQLYEIQYRTIKSLVPAGNYITIGPQGDTAFSLQGLSPNTLYQVNMRAYTLTGYGPDNVQVIRTLQQTTGGSQSSTQSINSATTSTTTSQPSTISTSSTLIYSTNNVPTTITGINPTIVPLVPNSEGTPVSTIALSVVLSVTVLIIIVIILIVIIQRCWWNHSGSKGNYSPEKIEELHQRKLMLNFEPQPITPPANAFDSGTDSCENSAVEVIRVDQLYQSTDHIFQYDSLDALSTQK